jgi:hypothetical protein
MPQVFLTIALILSGLAILLWFAGERRLLNFVDDGAAPAARINRHAALRLLLPVCVNAGCAWAAAQYPQLTVPLLFLTPLSILATVLWIGVGAGRLQARPATTP